MSDKILDHITVPVPQVRSMCSALISINLESPPFDGNFTTKWRLCTPEKAHFGETIICSINVAHGGTLALTQQLNKLHTSNTATVDPPPPIYPQFGPTPNPTSSNDDDMWDDYN